MVAARVASVAEDAGLDVRLVARADEVRILICNSDALQVSETRDSAANITSILSYMLGSLPHTCGAGHRTMLPLAGTNGTGSLPSVRGTVAERKEGLQRSSDWRGAHHFGLNLSAAEETRPKIRVVDGCLTAWLDALGGPAC